MATTTEPRPSASASPAGAGRPREVGMGRERPVGGLELWSWLFMRISGIVLLVLAVGHVLIMHLPAGGVSRINFGFVATRWQSPFWRSWDWALLVLALVHGINGLRVITLDYVKPAGARFAVNMLFYTLGFVLFVLGTVIVFTFDPAKWGVHVSG
jgi:succinate dehydrogenase / fumarate reductase, membrane anchor subunit